MPWHMEKETGEFEFAVTRNFRATSTTLFKVKKQQRTFDLYHWRSPRVFPTRLLARVVVGQTAYSTHKFRMGKTHIFIDNHKYRYGTQFNNINCFVPWRILFEQRLRKYLASKNKPPSTILKTLQLTFLSWGMYALGPQIFREGQIFPPLFVPVPGWRAMRFHFFGSGRLRVPIFSW